MESVGVSCVTREGYARRGLFFKGPDGTSRFRPDLDDAPLEKSHAAQPTTHGPVLKLPFVQLIYQSSNHSRGPVYLFSDHLLRGRIGRRNGPAPTPSDQTMYFERKELIQSLDLLCFVLFVYTWLLDNSTFLLLLKAALQVQFCNPLQMHSTWSLPFFLVFLACWNLVPALSHLLFPPSVTNTGNAVFIDFIGQNSLPGRLHILSIDAFTFAIQLVLTVVAFEMGKDEARPDGEPSELDDLTSMLGEEDLGQGWDVRDEEARLFGLNEGEERKRERSSLTHHIAVVRLRPIWEQIRQRKFLPSPPSEEEVDANPTPPPLPLDQERPDTTRIRSFSRRSRTVQTTPAEPVSQGIDSSWPPMWLIIARNMVGSQPRLPSFHPIQTLGSIRDSFTSRFGRAISHATPDRSQYTRVSDAPPPQS